MSDFLPRAMPRLWERSSLARALSSWRSEGSIERVSSWPFDFFALVLEDLYDDLEKRVKKATVAL